ncbi:hypothetical protein MTR67_019109 [Solanum verrucosum]|uniref:Uncharacterized protein n=1 Tax=Solanum verrucosum TaxID=315347 RepID=A0AAF0QKX1_SOLVR|nr:hypothetical protein MTR67_019109 [Solanum verrucosum]
MPLRRFIGHMMQTRSKGRPARKDENPQVLQFPVGPRDPNAPVVQPPQADVTNVEFLNAIHMSAQATITPVDRQGEAPAGSSGVPDASRIRDFFRMNLFEFTRSNLNEDPYSFGDEILKIFQMMHRKKNRGENAPFLYWRVFEDALMGHFFPRELREAKRTENGNQSSFQWRSSGPAPSLVSSHAPKPLNDHRGREFGYHRSVLPRDTLVTRNAIGHILKDCHSKRQGNEGKITQSTTSLAPAGQNFRKGTTSGANDSQNHFYALSSHQVQENSPGVVTYMLQFLPIMLC